MKHIKKLYEFLILENNNESLFKNEKELKDLLLKDEDFANGEVHQGIMNVIHKFWDQKMSYDDIIYLVSKKFGKLPLLALLLGKYNYQVGNGGHIQYYDNGYASSESRGFGYSKENINIHEEFLNLFKDLEMDEILANGKKAYDIINSFELDLEDEIDSCPECNGNGRINCYKCDGNGVADCEECGGDGEIDDETCGNCGGDGTIECDECDGRGDVECDECNGKGEYETGQRIPDTNYWEKLDSRWYEIEEDLMSQFEDYLKRQTLDGDKIEDLIPVAKSTQKYNL